VERRETIGPRSAKLIGFLVLVLVNQGFAFTLADRATFAARLLHRALDAGQLLALGLLSLLASEFSSRVLRRFGRSEASLGLRALLLSLAVLLVSAFVLPEDVTNAAGRYGLPVWGAVAIGSAGFALVLGASVFVRAVDGFAIRAAAAGSGLALAVANGLVLVGDYPGIHSMVGWLAALLVAHAVEGARLRLPLPPRTRLVLLGVLGALSLAALAVPPPQAVRRRLLALPGAVAAPFFARLWREPDGSDHALVPRAVRKSPWFVKRKHLKPTPPTGALALPEPKLVLFLTIDAMRADVLDPNNKKTLPTLFRLKSRGASFTRARSAASSTRPSMSSVFTGRYYSQLRFRGSGSRTVLNYQGPRFPKLLTDAGVHTVSLPLFFRISAESGVGRGFATEIRDVRGAAATVTKLIELAKHATGPTLLYAHFGEPHAPYTGKGKTPRERYLDEVSSVDRELGRLVSALNDAGLGKRALYVITADHGEAFMEHGVGNHARVIYEEVARIPLLVYGPGVVRREIDEPVSLIDMAPTLLDLFDVPAPGPFMGQSLVPLIAGKDLRLERPIAIQATHGLCGLYVGNHKVIFDIGARTIEVYDLARDRGETQNLADSDDLAVRTAIQTAELFMKVNGKARRSYDRGGD
jgi:hypothetical protein